MENDPIQKHSDAEKNIEKLCKSLSTINIDYRKWNNVLESLKTWQWTKDKEGLWFC